MIRARSALRGPTSRSGLIASANLSPLPPLQPRCLPRPNALIARYPMAPLTVGGPMGRVITPARQIVMRAAAGSDADAEPEKGEEEDFFLPDELDLENLEMEEFEEEGEGE
eukprot:gene10596-12262_t